MLPEGAGATPLNVIATLQKNLENLGSMHNYGRVDPLFDKLHKNPRYAFAMSKTAPPDLR